MKQNTSPDNYYTPSILRPYGWKCQWNFWFKLRTPGTQSIKNLKVKWIHNFLKTFELIAQSKLHLTSQLSWRQRWKILMFLRGVAKFQVAPTLNSKLCNTFVWPTSPTNLNTFQKTSQKVPWKHYRMISWKIDSTIYQKQILEQA